MSGRIRLRVVTYNVRGLRAGVDVIARVVRALDPDVLLLQETGSRRALRTFARETGMVAAADPWSPLRRRVKDAVLARDPWSLDTHRLHRFAGSSGWYPRGVLIARLGAEGIGSIWAASVHLGLDGAERGRHARELVELIDELEPTAAVVVGGDLNATPEHRAVATIGARLTDALGDSGIGPHDAPTFPASAPTARIDHVFVSEELRVVAASVGAEGASGASDHLPVIVDVEGAKDQPRGRG